jgi:hypothetical protein
VRRLAPFVIGLGIVMLVVGIGGALTQGGDSDDATATRTRPAEPVPTTASPTTAAPTTTPTTTPAETPQAFFALLGRAFASDDDTFLFDRLHPLVLTRYGAEQCRAYFAGQSVPRFSVEVLESRVAEAWDWTLDGRTDRLPSAIPVRIRSTDDGTTFRENEAHVVLVDSQVRWFTDCGTPI